MLCCVDRSVLASWLQEEFLGGRKQAGRVQSSGRREGSGEVSIASVGALHLTVPEAQRSAR